MPDISGFYTVVYQVMEGHHEEWWQNIQPIFLKDDQPISVVSITVGDLAEKVDQMESSQ